MRRPPSKYHAVKTTVDGIMFASKKEARRYAELKLREKAGDLRRLEVQPAFKLFAHDLTVGAKLKRAAAGLRGRHDPVIPILLGTYIADFAYDEKVLKDSENDHFQRVVEDVKGFKTPLYRWKKKYVEAQYGIQIREI